MSRFRAAFRALLFGGGGASPRADLQVSVSSNVTSQYVTRNVTFTVTLTNLGSSGATGVQVTSLLPAGFTYVSNTPSTGSYDTGTGVWNVGSLANGGSETLQLVGTILPSGSTTLTATITATSPTDPNSSNDTSSQAITVLNQLSIVATLDYGWMGEPFCRGPVVVTDHLLYMNHGWLGEPFVTWSNV